ncbi:tyrosine-type recombinase/integrase [Tepidamorphus sp. 3E244]|uniref:tyrosine-type recombinase/integrase n=1 Tax=Tepidamorphus sp. 3E244 TaxID=3385498 RepID=UPI0038FCF18A
MTQLSQRKPLSDKQVRDLEPHPQRNQQIVYDTQVTGFGIRITATGKKSFILNYHVNGRERRRTIGHYPAWSVAAARKQAAEWRRMADAGVDPAEEKKALRDARTVDQLWERYRDEALLAKAKRSQADEISMWDTWVLPKLGTRRLSQISHSDIDKLHRNITTKYPVRANRIIASLRRAFNLAIRWEWVEANPAIGVALNPEEPRERYLSPREIDRLLDALQAHREQISCAVIRFLLLTGCRKGEALSATWDQIDFDEETWTKPSSHTKQKRPHRVPLSAAAVALLEDLKSTSKCKFIFSRDGKRPLQDIKRTWSAVRKDADINDVRLHDLRHSFASILASENHSLTVIGRLLGHTQPSTTARYAHLFDDPLRSATEVVSKKLTSK